MPGFDLRIKTWPGKWNSMGFKNCIFAMKLLMRMNCACSLRLTFLCCVSVYKFYAHDMIFFDKVW